MISQLYSYKLNQISTRKLNQTKCSTKDKHPLTKQLDLEVQIKISHLSTIHVLDRQNKFTEGAEKYFLEARNMFVYQEMTRPPTKDDQNHQNLHKWLSVHFLIIIFLLHGKTKTKKQHQVKTKQIDTITNKRKVEKE